MKRKSNFRIPIALHIYSSLIMIALITVFVIGVFARFIINNYIETECERRIVNATTSCQAFAKAFNTSVPEDSDSIDSEVLRDQILNAIVESSDLSTDASLALFNVHDSENNFNLMWPEEFHSISTYNHTNELVAYIIDKESIDIDGLTHSISYNGDKYYYHFMRFTERNSTSSENHYEDYYLLIYINSSTYYSFANALNDAILRAIFVSVIASAFISLIMALPLYTSTKKLSRFANRIGKGNFSPLKGHIVSRELSDLGDVMNSMAQKLEKSDIEQKTFFQNASHELRTPLMSIQGYAEGIKYDVFDDEHRQEAVDIIISETTRLSGLVENLLSISKMDMSKNGSYQVKKSLLDVVDICEFVVEKVRGGFLHNGKELINDIKINDVYVYGNENDIFRMLENIFSNCLRYAESQVKFKVYVDNSDNSVVFEISDDGPGISPEVLPHLFDRFAKGADGKHGIGMALAKSIAIEHGGSIEGFNDSGAVFRIKLPIINPQEQMTYINNSK
ncbi:MAG: HAMP domain-containing histidine kinase [Saccharofermentans sp.]|nr:HAMP domain-containing histidine kinase [Saccharofermentans sp.]